MLRLALLGANAALPQHVPRHVDDLKPHPKEGAEAAVLHCCRSNPSSRLVHDLPGGTMESDVLHLVAIDHLGAAPVVVAPVSVACVVIVVVDGDVTHLWVLGGGHRFHR
jgi:hypothetical protein